MEVGSFAVVAPLGDAEMLFVVDAGYISNGLTLAFDREKETTIPLTIKILASTVYPKGWKATLLS